jgi:hypothetical protein
MEQLDEQARQLQPNEPEVAELLEEAADEVALTELHEELAVLNETPLQSGRRRRLGMVERAMSLLRQSRTVVSRANRDRALARSRADMELAIQEMREAENNIDVQLPANYKRRRMDSPEEAMLRYAREKLVSALGDITSSNFHLQSRSDKITQLEAAIGCLNALKGPYDVFRSHYIDRLG